MEVDERPKEQYSDIGGLDKQIEELIEAVVLPMQMKDKFINLGIVPPKGVLLYGPPGTGNANNKNANIFHKNYFKMKKTAFKYF